MGARLGTVLLRDGRITPEQLDEALQLQVIYGGKLGTNLVELGHIDEPVLAECLSAATGFPRATSEHFADAGPDVLALIDSETAGKYECYPLQKEGRKLHLAMANPADLPAIDEISFKTGLRVVPYIATEVRMQFELERGYGIQRNLRYIRLSPREQASLRGRTGEVANRPLTSGRPPSSPPPLSSSSPPPVRTAAPVSAPPPVASSPVAIPVVPGGVMPPLGVEQASQLLDRARTREEIADAVLAHAVSGLDGACLLLVQDNQVLGWKARGTRLSPGAAANVAIPLERPSMFRNLVMTSRSFAGSVAPVEVHRQFFEALGIPTPPWCVLIPVILRGRVVNLIYGECFAGEPPGLVDSLTSLGARMGEAYERLVREGKRRAAGSQG